MQGITKETKIFKKILKIFFHFKIISEANNMHVNTGEVKLLCNICPNPKKNVSKSFGGNLF